MKTIKSSLLLLILFFGLGVLCHAQTLSKPCIVEDVMGQWTDQRGNFGIQWIFFDSEDVVCFGGTESCQFPVYQFGLPLKYTINTPGEMTIIWSLMRDGVTYGCVIANNRMVLRSINPRDGIDLIKNSPLTDNEVANVPTLSAWGLVAMAVLMGLIGLILIRRKATA